MRRSSVCVDASLTIKLVLPEEDSDRADALWAHWELTETAVLAPTLWAYEVTSVIRTKVHRRLLLPEREAAALDQVHRLEVELHYPAGLHRRAWELARQFGRPAAYDSHYLALAEMLGCPFWTADERLFRAVERDLDWVRWLRDYQP